MKRLVLGMILFAVMLVNIAPAFARGAGHQHDWSITKYHQPSPHSRDRDGG